MHITASNLWVKEANNDKLTIYYDGACSLCCKKMSWLQKQDKLQKLEFIDIASPDFTDPRVAKISRLELNISLHLRTSEGLFFKDLDAIHLAYKAVGLGWITAPTRIFGIRFISDRVFDQWKKKVRGITS